jgi:uncharacterized membrane protein YbhN (UPF0104 family)
MKKNNRLKYLKLLVKLSITVFALWYVFRKIEFSELVSTIATANPFWLFVALVMFALSKLVSAFRLNTYFRQIQIDLSEGYNIRLYMLGMYYNLFLPGGIGGDGYKVYLLNKKYPVPGKKIFWAVLLDRIIGVLALFCMAVLLSLFIPYPDKYKYAVWLLIPLSIFTAYVIYRQFFGYFKKIFFKTNFQSFWVQLFQLICAVFILLALHVESNYLEYLFVFLLSSIIAVLPISIGGLGAREITFLFGAQYLMLDESNAVALSSLFYIITALVSLTGIYYSIWPEKMESGTAHHSEFV